MKCLEKDRKRRYESASGLARDIQRHLNSEPVVARPPSRLYEFKKTVVRHKVGFAAVTAVILVLAAGVVASVIEAGRAWRAERAQSALREEAQRARVIALAQERNARLRAYASDLGLAQTALAWNSLGRGRELLNHQRPKPSQEDLRGWEWRYLWQYARSDIKFELCQQASGIVSLAVSGDGRWLAVAEQRQAALSVGTCGRDSRPLGCKGGMVNIPSSALSRRTLRCWHIQHTGSSDPPTGISASGYGMQKLRETSARRFP
jgi:hypothetical protein